MTEIETRLPSGVPCWIDLGVPDYRRAMDFYRALFGWEFEVGPPALDHYTHCFARGLLAAAISTPPEASTPPEWDPHAVLTRKGRPSPIGGIHGTSAPPGPGGRAHWLTYFGVEDADTAARVTAEQGGSVRQAPEDSPCGRRTMLADPFGAIFGAVEVPATAARHDLVR